MAMAKLCQLWGGNHLLAGAEIFRDSTVPTDHRALGRDISPCHLLWHHSSHRVALLKVPKSRTSKLSPANMTITTYVRCNAIWKYQLKSCQEHGHVTEGVCTSAPAPCLTPHCATVAWLLPVLEQTHPQLPQKSSYRKVWMCSSKYSEEPYFTLQTMSMAK